MVALPTDTTTKTELAIYALYERQNDPARPYLGGSQIGESCDRRLWYSFRWAFYEKFEGRMLRLFETGHREEDRIILNLKQIGYTVFANDPLTGKQFRYTDHGGHYSGGLDGVVKGVIEAPKTPHLFEGKTHNQRLFNKLKKHGLEEAHPKHYAQCQSYMRMAKLKRTLYVAIHKDTDTFYIERIKYDAAKSKALHKKALRIIEAKEPLEKISQKSDYWECRFCPAHGMCHDDKVADVSCRTCVHGTPELEGDARWTCARYDCDIPEENQRTGCDSHLHIPALIPYAIPVDAGDDWIKYEMTDSINKGEHFIACAADGFPADRSRHYSSKELVAIDLHAIGNETVDAARTILEGEVVG